MDDSIQNRRKFRRPHYQPSLCRKVTLGTKNDYNRNCFNERLDRDHSITAEFLLVQDHDLTDTGRRMKSKQLLKARKMRDQRFVNSDAGVRCLGHAANKHLHSNGAKFAG